MVKWFDGRDHIGVSVHLIFTPSIQSDIQWHLKMIRWPWSLLCCSSHQLRDYQYFASDYSDLIYLIQGNGSFQTAEHMAFTRSHMNCYPKNNNYRHTKLTKYTIIHNHESLLAAGYSEDSDYTSDVNFPVNGHFPNAPASQYLQARLLLCLCICIRTGTASQDLQVRPCSAFVGWKSTDMSVSFIALIVS